MPKIGRKEIEELAKSHNIEYKSKNMFQICEKLEKIHSNIDKNGRLLNCDDYIRNKNVKNIQSPVRKSPVRKRPGRKNSPKRVSSKSPKRKINKEEKQEFVEERVSDENNNSLLISEIEKLIDQTNYIYNNTANVKKKNSYYYKLKTFKSLLP